MDASRESAPIRVVIYQRLSNQPGQKRSCAVQEQDNRAYCQLHRFEVAGSFTDDGGSGWKPGAHRAGYQAMLDVIRDPGSGITGVVVYMTSRFTRDRVERAQFVNELGRARQVVLYATQGMTFDLSNAQGRTFFIQAGEHDTHESERKSELIVREARARADRGQASSKVSYGWRREVINDHRGVRLSWRDVVDDRAAAVVVEIVQRIIAGDPITTVTRSLNERRIPTPREALRIAPGAPFAGAGKWIPASVRELALRESNAGLRTYHGAVIGAADAPALIDEQTHKMVGAILRDATRRTTRPGGRSHLLTYSPDLATCGRCGAVLRVLRIKGRPTYTCSDHQHISRDVIRTDAVVAATVLAWLADPDNRITLSGGVDLAPMVAELDALRLQSRDIADAFTARAVSVDQLTRINASLDASIAQVEQRIAAVTRAAETLPAVTNLTPDTWAGMDVLARRDVLHRLAVRVRLLPTVKGWKFHPEHIKVTIRAE